MVVSLSKEIFILTQKVFKKMMIRFWMTHALILHKALIGAI